MGHVQLHKWIHFLLRSSHVADHGPPTSIEYPFENWFWFSLEFLGYELEYAGIFFLYIMGCMHIYFFRVSHGIQKCRKIYSKYESNAKSQANIKTFGRKERESWIFSKLYSPCFMFFLNLCKFGCKLFNLFLLARNFLVFFHFISRFFGGLAKYLCFTHPLHA